jgi:hypothetical protein
MADAYRRSGGPVQFELLKAFGQDGHGLFDVREGVAVWSPLVRVFLAQHR